MGPVEWLLAHFKRRLPMSECTALARWALRWVDGRRFAGSIGAKRVRCRQISFVKSEKELLAGRVGSIASAR